MVAMHIFSQINHLNIKSRDDLSEDDVVSGLGTNIHSLSLGNVWISQESLVLSENIRGQLVDESLNCSRSMDIQGNVDDII